MLTKLPQAIAKAYLKRYPIKFRLAQYQALMAKWAWIQPILKEIREEILPPDAETVEETLQDAENIALAQIFPSPYPRYDCVNGDPLKCSKACATASDGDGSRIKNCTLCGFPTLLPNKSEIKGIQGLYRIDKFLGRRGMGRLYSATQLGVNQSIVIKEYILPGRYFNADEVKQQKQLFRNFGGITLADSIADFRMITPVDAIADVLEERCYLIMDGQNASLSINHYLAQGAFSSTQVKSFLQQVLQTLEFLHTQKFRFPNGQVQPGICHGNLNLDTLLSENLTPSTPLPLSSCPFPFIYLCDLAVWENIFIPSSLKPTEQKKSQDLIDLGYIAFYLLNGKVVTDEAEPLNPRNEKNWFSIDHHLKTFILRLMEIEMPFDCVSSARQELLRLPQNAIVLYTGKLDDVTEELPIKSPRIPMLLLSALGIGLVGLISWFLVAKPQASNATDSATPQCCIKDVAAIPIGKFTYTSTNSGIWSYVLQEPNLIAKGQTLEKRLFAAQPQLQLSYQPVDSIQEAIAKVQSGESDFAIIPLIQPLPSDLTSQAIAYDALAVFVAFSYSQRDQGLPENLQGKLTLEQLRQLYTGKVFNWRELGASELSVNLYAPQDKEATEIFTSLVFNKNNRDSEQANEPEKLADTSILTSLPEFEMMRTVIRDFESKKSGGIGFSSLSKIIGQCSVYPLALQAKGQSPQQAVQLKNGKDIDASTNLCDKKGSYFANIESLKTGRYPLAYPIAVIYPRDNNRSPIGEKFAAILKTSEGQKLLSKTGLTPLE
jgi:ABC-type phosphate transport system substrate-binding protein